MTDDKGGGTEPSGSLSHKEEPREITIHYEKSNHFRVIHVDGAFGGVSPHGLIDMSVFSERMPIPKSTVHPIKEGGTTLGEEVREKRIGKVGVFRELEANLLFSQEVAKTLVTWLTERIKQLEELRAQVPKERQSR